MKRQLSRLTFREKRQKENTTMKTDYPSSREKKSPPELFAHNLILAHMKQAKKRSRLARLSALLFRCIFVVLVEGTVFSTVNIAHALPVSDRTPQVRDAIVAAVPGVNSADDVTEAHLAAIYSLNLNNKNITTLKEGDFDGLTSLIRLSIGSNPFSSLPEGIFSGLTSLTTLDLGGGQISSLPADVFSGLTSLTTLILPANKLSSLPAGIFTGLSSLEHISLWQNQLSSLPAGIFTSLTSLTEIHLKSNKISSLPADVFSGLSSLTTIGLGGNQLSNLPTGLFSGLSSLTTLNLSDNAAELSLIIELQQVGGNQFKAVIATGAPFTIVVPLNVTNGSIMGGTTTATIPIGSVESAPFTVIPTPGTSDAVTLLIGTLSNLPSDHRGYTLAPFNLAPEFVEGPSTTRTVAEDIHTGGYIGTAVSATDPYNDPLTYTLSGADASSFAIDATTGQLRTSIQLDYETRSTYTVTVNVTDGTLTSSITVTINVTDVEPEALNVGEPRTVRLFYFLPNDRLYRADVVESMKTGILEVQSFYAEQMAAHGHGNMTFNIETDAQGDPIVHRIDADYGDSHYVNRGYTEGEIARAFDTSKIISAIVMDISSYPIRGQGTGNKSSGWLMVFKDWDWFTAAHELGHAFGLQHDLRDNTDILSYGKSDRSTATLSACAAEFLSVHPYFDSSIPLEIETRPTVELVSPTTYPAGAASVTIRVRVRDDSGLHQVMLFVRPNNPLQGTTMELKMWQKLDGETDTVVEFNFDGRVPSESDNTDPETHRTLANTNQHEIRVMAVDTEGNWFTSNFTLEEGVVQEIIIPLSDRTPQVRDAIVAAVPGVNSANDVTAAHLAAITSLSIRGSAITALRSGDFDGLTALITLSVGGTKLSSLPAGIFDNLPTLTELYLGGNNDLNSLPSGIFDNLTTLKKLYLNENGMPSLRSGVFDNLTVLEELGLGGNDLRSLPSGIFDNLTVLKKLNMSYNELVSLRSGIFDNNTALTELHLYYNDLRSLRSGVFDNNTALTTLTIWENNLSSLSAGIFDNNTALTNLSIGFNNFSSLPSGIFEKLTNLIGLGLLGNQFRSLPNGIFKGLPTLTSLNVSQNPVDPLLLTVSLEKVADGQFKAVALTGAPFEIVLPLSVTDGSISGGATSLTIPAGSVESETLTVTRTPGTNGAVSVWIGPLPSLPANHTGYRLAKATGEFNRLIIFDDISEQVWSGTVTGGSWGNDFGNGNATGRGYSRHYNAGSISNPNFTYRGTTYTIHGISFSRIGNNYTHRTSLLITPSFPACDKKALSFGGDGGGWLTDAVQGNAYGASWYLWQQTTANAWPVGHQIPWHITLHPTVPDAPVVTAINEGNQVTLSWATPCDGGKDITRHEYRQRTRDGAFGSWIPIPNSAAGGVNVTSYTFTNVNNPSEYTFEVRAVNELGEGLASALVSSSDRTPQVAEAILGVVRLNDPNVASFADITDSHLAGITSLYLNGRNITSLKSGDFEGLTSVTELRLNGNQLTTLPEGIFDGLTALRNLNLYNNRLSSLPAGLFEGLTSLTTIRLGSNAVDPLPFIVSLEKVAEGQFKAVAPAGAPFEIVLPISVTNGSINSGATSITIPSGSVESDTLTVNRTPGSTYATTIHIGILPSLPQNHSGYSLVKSDDLPITVIEGDIPDNSVLTLTVGAGPGAALRGYNPHFLPDWNFGSLSSPTFVLNGVSYTLHRLYYSVAGKRLDFQTSPMLRGFELHLDSHLLRSFSALDYNLHQWNNVNLNWSVGQTVQVRIVETTPMPPGAPTNLMATPGYESVTLTWELPTNANPTTLPITEYEFRGSDDGGNTWNPDWDIISSSRSGQSNRTSCTIGDSSHNPNVDDIIDINLTNGTSYTFEIRARGGDGSGDAARITVTPAGSTPVSQRTPRVRDAIVAAVPGVNSANDVTEAHLGTITSLDLSSTSITALKAGDFDGLIALTTLNLSLNQLSALPAGIFDNLNALTELYLVFNQLSALPADIFDNLNALTELYLVFNQLSALPAGIFDDLNALTELRLSDNQLSTLPANIFDNLNTLTGLNLSSNQLSTLPEGIFDDLNALTVINLSFNPLNALPEGIFDNLNALTTINLSNNQLNALPEGIFDNLNALTTLSLENNQLSVLPESIFDNLSTLKVLYLYGNSVDPLPLTISLEKVAEGQFKAVAPTGAPFEIVLPLTVTNGSINSGATSLTIPAGSVESDTFTVTRTVGTTADVTVDIGTLPSLPSGHTGYTLVKSTDLPLEVISGTATQVVAVNIPDPNLRAKIETALGKASGDPITATEIATLTTLNAQDARITNLAGLETATNLTELQLWDNQITNLSSLAGLTNLIKLYLWGNNISDISHLSGLTSLTQLRLGENSISNISAVSSLRNLTYLSVKENAISDISAVLGLTNLTQLLIGNNTISDITPVRNLINLTWLDMPNNRISDISVVQNLTQLVELYFQNNAVSDLLPLVANTGLGADDELDIRGNPLSYPDIYTHIPALQARNVYIDFDNRTPTAPTKISGDTQQGAPSTALAQPFVVEVQDGDSATFAGVPVTFAVTAGGGTLSVTSTATNTNGRAESTLILGSSAGTNTVRVSVQGVSQAATFTAEAATTNTAPVFTDGTSTTRAIAENIAAGINIGATIAATDANNDTLTYTLGGTDADSFAIDSTTGQLKTQAALDYETKSSYSVTVSVSDDNGGSDSITVTINVTDVDEQQTEQTDVTTYEAGDEIPLPSGFNTPRLTMGTGRSLTADNGTYTCVSEDNCIIQNGQVTQGTIEVTTVAANTAPMFTDGTSTTRSIAENTAAGVSIGTAITATDTNNDILTYTLSGTDANAFNIERTTGQLKTSAPLDYETKRSYTVTVTVSDGSLTDTITATINVSDIAETPANTGVCEVGDILSPGESCTYPGTDAEFSVLNNGNGQFLFFSSGNSLNIRNTTINGVSYTLVANKLASGSWEIEEIGDSAETRGTTNSAPVFTDGTSTTRSVAENTSANVNIGNAVAATDPENDTLTYTLSGTDAASFDIESTTGQLKTKSALDYETKSAYTVTITVSDSNLTDTITVTINVTNIAETSTATTAINIPDNNLRAKIEAALGKASGAPISAAEMETLTSLTAQDASISNLTGLETATNLTTLKLGNNSVSDLSPLMTLTKLTELQLWDNSISDISAVAGLTNLTRLYLWGNTISNISAVARLTNLTQLRLGENSISNIPALAGLTNLTELGLKENAISDISALAGLTNLTELQIGNNTISDISPVQNLTNLEWLDMPNNSISDISVVQNLTQLVELYFQNNAVSDLSPLVANTGLGTDDELDIRGNPLSYPSIYTHIPALQARDVYIDFDNRVATASLKISGDTQQGAPSTALAQPFVVEVQDANSVVFAGVPVTFAVTAGGGTLSVTSTATNTNGRAESTLILGSSAGTNTVRVSVQGVSQAATFTAEAITTNTAPVFTDGTSTTRAIAENTAAGINIGATIAATDANNDTLTYTLGGTDAASFSISSSTGQLQTKSALDYETKTVYTVTVTVSDGTLTDSITVTINITDVAETPANTGVCQVGDVLAPGESCTYPSTAATFSVHNNGNGQFLFFTSGSNLNIKNTVINGQSYTLVANKLASGSWKIEEIADSAAPATTNTAPVFTEGASTTRTIAENTAAGVNIGTAVAATDADNDTLTYTLGGTDASAFDIGSTTGQLRTRATLDYETKRAYNVSVSVSDGTLTDSITVTINVTDIVDPPVVSTLIPVCDRTTQVRDAIVAAVPGVSDCNDVTEAHLAAITRLDLENKNISSLKDGDFDGMTALYELKLQNNQLQTLPANIFSDLSSLRTLYLNNNRLSSLPSTVFSGLSSLSNLYMNNNQLTSLPALVFSGLTSLRQINMHTNLLTTLPVNVFSGLSSLNQISINNNRLTSLPENVFSGRTGLIYLYLDGNRLTSLPANLFSGLSALEQLKFNNNRLSTLPAGLFRGLSSLTWLLVQGNTVNPLPFTVSLEKVGTNQFKATAPVGAPFAMTIPIPVVNGSISGGATTLTIPAGDVESAPLTVTRTLGTTGAVTVDIGTLPGLPTQHQGYELVKSSNLPLTVINVLSNSAPVFTDGTSATRTIAENTASGVNIGSPVSATDANNDTLTYSLSGTDAASFDIDTTNGQLQTQAALDYETKSSYMVTVTVSDGDLTDTITVTVNITDIDELPTNTGVCKVGDILAPGESCTYPGTDATFSVLDNGQAQWNIPDLPPLLQWINQTSISGSLSISTTINGETYHFVAEELSSGSWEIKEIGDSGTQQPDPPEQPQPPVTESDPPTLSASTAAPLTEATLHEGVVTLTLNDGTYEWASSTIRNAVTVSTGITGVTVRSFDIDRVSDTEVIVELTFDGTDFDTNSTLTFTVGAGAIAGYDGAALTAQVPVTASTESVVASTTSPLTEDTLDGSVVTLTLSGRNYESSGVRIRNAVTVSGIDGVTVGTFDIDRVSDTQVTVELTFDGNISTDGTLTFTVGPGAIAGYNGPALTTQVSVTASTETPTPTNTAPTFTAGSTTTRTVAENTVANVNVGSAVAATDANNDTLTYTLGGTDANVFSIESTTGQLKTRAALDYETKRTYTVTITVSDGNGGSDSITVTITVTNVVENRAPVFTDGVSTTRSVTENTAARQNIGRTISATDPNGDTLRYNLSGTEAASFRIDGTTGQLRTWAALDYETKRTYTVTVTVSDGSLTDTITVTINVTDVDDTPTLNVSTAVPLTEATLHGSVVTLTLSKSTYHTNWNFVSQNVEVSGITGVRRHNVVRASDTKVTVELEFNGNISTNSTLTFTVGAGAIANYNGPALTAQLRVSSSTESLIATTAAPLTEVTLNGSIVTLTLSGATYHTNWNFVSRSVEVSGITGVRQYHVDRVSDTEVTVELEFNGNINADSTLTFTVGADAIANYNGPAFTAQVPVSANTESLIATTAAPLTEATLDGNVVTLRVTGGIYKDNWNVVNRNVKVSGIAGVTFSPFNLDIESDTEITVELDFDGTDFDANSTLTFTVELEAMANYTGPALTAQIPVTANTESVVATTVSPLTEATLDGSVVTLTLSGRTYERSIFTIRDAVTVSGITGVTVGTFGVGRVSDTQITVELTFDGNINTDSTLTFTVGADAIVGGYNGSALTSQVSVSAGDPPEQPQQPEGVGGTPTLSASTAAPLTEATLDESVVTLTLSGRTYEQSNARIRTAVTISGIAGVTARGTDIDRVSDTQVTVELTFDRNINTDGTLTFTVGARAIADYNGSPLTTQIPVTAIAESVVATTAAPLTEATLDESVVTLTLNSRSYENSRFTIRDAVTVSGIAGVTVGTFGVDRVSDTTITVELTFDGNINTGSTLTFTVGADAIARYNGPALTAQVSVSAGDAPAETGDQNPDPPETPQQPVVTGDTPTLSVTTASPLTEATLHGGIITLTLSGGTFRSSIFWIRNAVSVSGINGVTVESFGRERISNTQATIELEYNGNMTANGTLTISVGAGAIEDYDGAALTSQISVPAVTESVAASTDAPLTEATLDESVVTLTLSGRTYESFRFTISDAVSVSGISGVTVGTFDIGRVSDTEVTVELTFSGDFDTDATLTFTVGAGAIAGYDGAALTAQVPVTATVQVLRAPSGISLIHVPLKVTAVDGVPKTIESVGDLYNALGGVNTVNLLITHNPKTQEWHSYLGEASRGTSADTILTDNQGIIADMKTLVSLQLDGNALGRNGSSVITLHPGTNLVAMPLSDSRITRVSDLLALEGIGGNVSAITVSNNGSFQTVEQAGDAGDIPITGGQSFILNARETATVAISGQGWDNVSGAAAAAPGALTGIEAGDATPVLALRGSIVSPVGGWGRIPHLRSESGFHVIVKNLSTGSAVATVIGDTGDSYQLTVVDTETGQAARIGDILEISVRSPNPLIGVQPLRYTVTAEDVRRSRIQLPELTVYEIPAETELLRNYPNPFNPETWIPYRLAEDAFVTLTIYDTAGRVVRSIDVGYKPAAAYESRSKAIYWDGRNEFGEQVASSVYFYHLSAGDYSATRKMLIVK